MIFGHEFIEVVHIRRDTGIVIVFLAQVPEIINLILGEKRPLISFGDSL
jgi:hypothetical protein